MRPSWRHSFISIKFIQWSLFQFNWMLNDAFPLKTNFRWHRWHRYTFS
jgi:hypothetical protein